MRTDTEKLDKKIVVLALFVLLLAIPNSWIRDSWWVLSYLLAASLGFLLGWAIRPRWRKPPSQPLGLTKEANTHQ